jgi:hypothetical protein
MSTNKGANRVSLLVHHAGVLRRHLTPSARSAAAAREPRVRRVPPSSRCVSASSARAHTMRIPCGDTTIQAPQRRRQGLDTKAGSRSIATVSVFVRAVVLSFFVSSSKIHNTDRVFAATGSRTLPFEFAMDALRSLADVGKARVRTALNIKVPTVVSTRPGRLLRVSVVRAGTTPGAVCDAGTLAGTVAASRIATIPRTIAMYEVEWPRDFGIVVVPGAGQVLAVVFV